MKPQDQNIAVAKAFGYKLLNERTYDGHTWQWLDPSGVMVGQFYSQQDAESIGIECLPKYHSDLNAMAEAEKILTPDQEDLYIDRLSAAIMTDAYENDPRYIKSHLSSTDSTYRATASQRCEAFLMTKGLWVE